MKLYMRKFCY